MHSETDSYAIIYSIPFCFLFRTSGKQPPPPWRFRIISKGAVNICMYFKDVRRQRLLRCSHNLNVLYQALTTPFR